MQQQPIRRRVIYSGHVQGVGFRATAVDTARGFDVVGYVKNLPDGRVELAAEGTPTEVESFLQRLRQKMEFFIQDEKASSEPLRGEHQFRIER